jgi:hypothetical protein
VAFAVVSSRSQFIVVVSEKKTKENKRKQKISNVQAIPYLQR